MKEKNEWEGGQL